MMNRRFILISWYAIVTFEIKQPDKFIRSRFLLFLVVVYSGENNVCAVTLISFEYS